MLQAKADQSNNYGNEKRSRGSKDSGDKHKEMDFGEYERRPTASMYMNRPQFDQQQMPP